MVDEISVCSVQVFLSFKVLFVAVLVVGFGQHSLASNITLLRTSEVDEILEGNDDKYKALTVTSDVVLQRFVALNL